MTHETSMILSAILLLVAHVVADFPLQPDALIRRKREPGFFALHILVVGLTAALALGGAPPLLLAALIMTHAAMDAIKILWLDDDFRGFALDQAVHLAVIATLALVFPTAAAEGLWAGLPPDGQRVWFGGLIVICGAWAAIPVGGLIIAKAIAPFAAELDGEIEGLADGGATIGKLERALVFLLILINQPAGVGFLIAAKSILRFGDIKESIHQKRTEYIIIGTFMSFGWGLLVASLTQAGLAFVAARF